MKERQGHLSGFPGNLRISRNPPDFPEKRRLCLLHKYVVKMENASAKPIREDAVAFHGRIILRRPRSVKGDPAVKLHKIQPVCE